MNRFGQKERHQKRKKSQRDEPRQEVHVHPFGQKPHVGNEGSTEVPQDRPESRNEASDSRRKQFGSVGVNMSRDLACDKANDHCKLVDGVLSLPVNTRPKDF